jgi:hypothetical protein
MATPTNGSASVLNQWLWTWRGTFFGYRRRDSLFTYDGREVGRFDGKEVYGPNVHYLGELRNDRLIVKESQKAQKRGTFIPAIRIAYEKQNSVNGRALPAGYEDFPAPEKI